jgi:hypothetical protein
LKTCKCCRAAFLGKLRDWRRERIALRSVPKDHDGYTEYMDTAGSIPVRIDGINVMMSAEQYEEYLRRNSSEETA